jgi:hypothetical protein
VHQIAGELRRAHEIREEREAAAAKLRSAEEIRAERAAKQANEHTTAGPSTQQSIEGSCEGSKDGSCELGPEHALATPTRVEVRIFFFIFTARIYFFPRPYSSHFLHFFCLGSVYYRTTNI